MFPSVYNFQTLFNVPVSKIKLFTYTSTLRNLGGFRAYHVFALGDFVPNTHSHKVGLHWVVLPWMYNM